MYGGAARRSYGRGPFWDFVWDFAHLPWRVAAHYEPRLATKVAIAGTLVDGETRTRTGDTTIFRESARRVLAHERPADLLSRAVILRRDPVTFGRLARIWDSAEGSKSQRAEAAPQPPRKGRSAVCATLGSQTLTARQSRSGPELASAHPLG
jgi:hypothetical protein